MELIPDVQHLGSIHVIYHINMLKNKSHMFTWIEWAKCSWLMQCFFHVRNSEGRNTEEMALHRNTPACVTLSGKMLNDFSRNRAQGKRSTLINLHSTSTWPSHWKWVRGKKGVWLESKYWSDVFEDNGTIITRDPQQSGRTSRLGM